LTKFFLYKKKHFTDNNVPLYSYQQVEDLSSSFQNANLRELFDQMPERDLVSCNLISAGRFGAGKMASFLIGEEEGAV